jgi:TRAP transporter 4TM/12TM fusion protein
MVNRVLDILIAITGVGMVVYHLIYSQYLLQGPKEHWITHLGFALLLTFLISLRKGGKFWPMKLALILATISLSVYLWVQYPRLEMFGMLQANHLDLLVGAILILLCLEGARQSFGLVVPMVALLAIGYMFFGSYLPDGLFHAMALKPDIVLEILTVGFADTGIFGPMLSVSATYIFLFMVFAALVQTSGANEFFNQVGNLVGRKVRSSAAMAAVVTSGLVGSISGQSGPNVMITGSFTIPAMKKLGYKPEQAGGIEAAASTGGPIIPPVMGVAAFLMVGITGIPYSKIIGVAVLPAILYVFSAGLYVEFQAAKLNITPQIIDVNYQELILRAPLFLCPLAAIIILFVMGYTPLYVSFWACIIILALSLLRKQTRPSLKSLIDGLVHGASIGASVATICAVLGLVLAAITNTGLGVRLPAAIGALAGENLLLALILTGMSSLILGIGMPASAAYILVAVVLAPVLVKMGVNLLAAHLFAFYLANFSYLTPPVALSAVFAAKLAGGNFLKTAFESVKVGIGGFVLPFMIVWVEALTWDFSAPFFAVVGLMTCFITFIGIQACLVGYFLNKIGMKERLILGISPICLMIYLATRNILWFVAGVGILVILFLWERRQKKVFIMTR